MGTIVLGRRRIDTARLEARIDRAMSGLASLGIGEGDAVALMMRNDIAFVEASAAIAGLGACLIPINWHARADEVGYILRDSGAKLIIAHSDLAPVVQQADIADLLSIFVETPQEVIDEYALGQSARQVPAGAILWDPWVGGRPPFAGSRKPPGGNILYTSGTTGLPKGIQRESARSAAHQQRHAQSLRDTFGVRPGVRSVICGPLYHSMQNANLRTVLDALGQDGVMVIETRFDPEKLLQRIQEYRITQLMLVPIMFVRLLRLDASVREGYDVSSLEWVVHSAAPCSFDLKKRMIEWFGPVINEFYATSETGAVTLIGPADAMRKPGSVGRALPGCTVKILDGGARELAPGTPGEIAALNRAYPDFTYRNRPAERRALDRGGLVATGDIGYVDEDGFLFLCGRKDDMVISGGVNIFPAEVEAALLSLPGVRDCAVFGIPDAEYGQVLAAHVELIPGAGVGESDIRSHLNERIARYKVPRIIRFDDALPREDTGKIFKQRIRERYWSAARRGT